MKCSLPGIAEYRLILIIEPVATSGCEDHQQTAAEDTHTAQTPVSKQHQ